MDWLTDAFNTIVTYSGINLESLLLWLTGVSLLTFALSVVLLPYLIRRIPSNYFLQLSKTQPTLSNYRVRPILIYLFRNIFGFFLLISGVAMLFLPGQGLITLFIALLLLDFPWKRRLVAYLVSIKKIQSAIDWVRKKSKTQPINWPPDRK